LYQEADLFVLPSFSENFGLVIAEALASGVPVITTRATPWSELEEFGCGWWIGVGVEPLVTALREATALPREALREMGRRGRLLIEQRYDWEELGRQMAKVYEGIRKEVGSS
jgi:glycosyltransferase involved in cell wall biosynthesis